MAKKSTIKEKQLRSQDDSRKLRDISRESGGGELGVNVRQGEPKLVGEVKANVKLTNAGD